MKTKLIPTTVVALLLGLAVPAFAADKEVTLKGEAKCAKCAMKEGDKCQTVIQAEKDGKTVNYYLAANDVAKDFHHNVCKGSEKVKATGTDKVVEGKHEFTAKKIEVVKD